MALRPRAKQRARGRSFGDLGRRLEASGHEIEARVAAARDTARHREALNHIVGIERWGQRRIREALGEPAETNGHRRYRLPEAATLAELGDAFTTARGGTVALTEELERSATDPARIVRHGDLGDLTVLEWFAYLEDHASREARRLRTR